LLELSNVDTNDPCPLPSANAPLSKTVADPSESEADGCCGIFLAIDPVVFTVAFCPSAYAACANPMKFSVVLTETNTRT